MILCAIFKTHFSPVERKLARRQYKMRVLDPACVTNSDTETDDDVADPKSKQYLMQEILDEENHKHLLPLVESSYRKAEAP